jgi:ribonuclease G
MAKNLLVINVDIRETRVALIENGIIAELHIERESSKGTLGNIYLGRVSRVLPGMQAAFIDVGLERAAFLHVEDLIRPDDFEAYLAGHRRSGGTDEERTSVQIPAVAPLGGHAADEPATEADEEPLLEEPTGETTFDGLSEAEQERDVKIELPTALDVADTGDGSLGDEEEDQEFSDNGESTDADEEPGEAVEGAPSDEAEGDLLEAAEGAPSDEAEGDSSEVSDRETLEVVKTPAGVLAAPPAAEIEVKPEDEARTPRARSKRGRGGRDTRVRRSGRTRDRRTAEPGTERGSPPEGSPRESSPREGGGREGGGRESGGREGGGRAGGGREGGGRAGGGREGGGREGGGREGGGRARSERGGRGERSSGRGEGGRPAGREQSKRHHEPPRVSKTTPIREVVREGQEVLVQISKEPIGTKGARVTSHISLPGRYVVYLPTVDHVGISKRIGSDKERSRLREAMEAMKPPQGGLIVRTVAEGLTKKQLKADVGYLVRLWGEVVKKREAGVRAAACLYTELDLVLKTARDLFTDDIEKIVIDSPEEYHRLRRFVEMFLPERANAVELYEGQEPIFDAYGIEDEIQRAQSRKVPLPSGGYLIIDQAEALTAIDVNTGRFVGKGSKDLEETILATNLEAVEEIAYQLRFRNIGGLIILDLIDMERTSNREKVRKRMEELLARDKAKTTVNRISDLGLIEMTRKRTRESLGRTVLEPCFYCDGTGQLQSKQTIAYEILRQIRRERMNLPGYVIIVNAHPAVIDLLKSDERIAVQEAERLFQRRLELVPRKEYHLEQFDLQGR